MGKLPIKNGTPVGSASLCKTCISAQIMSGFRESELITICQNVNPNLVVPFNIYECSEYYDKNRPSWDEMKKLAIDVEPRTTLKPVGFKIGAGFAHATTIRTDANEEDEESND